MIDFGRAAYAGTVVAISGLLWNGNAAQAIKSGFKIDPCKLLTGKQVSTVLPKHDVGSGVHDEKSLSEGIDIYQCSYVNKDSDLFTIKLHIAADDARFAKIKPDGGTLDGAQSIYVGDGGWVRAYSSELKLTALKGRTVIDLDLIVPEALDKVDDLTALAKVIAGAL